MPAWFVVSGLLACTEPTAPPTAEALRWRAPAQCPTSDVVAARARALGPADLDASATIEAVPGGFAAQVEHGGRRHELRSASCDELATAVALLLAGMDVPPPEPLAGESAPGVRVPAQPEPAAAPAAAPASVASSASADRSTRRPPRAVPHWPRDAEPPAILGPYVLAAATVGVGSVPRIDVGGRGALGWSWTRVALEVGAFGLAPMRRAIDATTSGTIMVAASSVHASARLRWARVELRPGGAFEAGASRVRARGEVVRRIGRAPWLALRAELRLLAWLHARVAATVAAAMIVPLLQTRYRIGEALLFEGRPVGFAATLGLTIALGRDA